MPDDPRYYMDFTGTGNCAQPGAPARAAADHGLAALLRDRLPRRRLPLRPRVGARARVLRGRPPVGVLRHHPPGPGALAGEADRRAVGRRARAATRSATSRCSGRSGTASTATRCATSGAGEASVGRVRLALHRLERPLPVDDGRAPFASINFITAHDGFTLADLVSYNDKHNEANGEDNRDGTDDNRSWNCGVEGPTDDPEINALRARQQRELPRDAVPLAGRADAARRRRARPHAARQQQRVVPGQRDLLVRLGLDADGGAARVHAAADPSCGSEHPVFRRRDVPDGRRGDAARACPTCGGSAPDGRAHDADATGSATTAHTLGVFLNGEEIPTRTPRRRARSSTTRSCCSSTPTHEPITFMLPTRRFGARWRRRALDDRRARTARAGSWTCSRRAARGRRCAARRSIVARCGRV